LRPWLLIDYPDVPASVGRFEGEAFDPALWKPEYPNPAFDNMRPDDAFWAARIVARFSDAAIRGIIEKAQYSDDRATDYLTTTLITRRDKVLRTWLNGVNPAVDLSLSANGRLTWRNAAVDARVADAPRSYTLRWFEYNNTTDERRATGDVQTVQAPEAPAPMTLVQGAGEYIGVVITADHPQHPAWSKPATFYFRRAPSGWTWVGAERE
jgi:hypothetical protein